MTVTRIEGGADNLETAMQVLAAAAKIIYVIHEPRKGLFLIYHQT